MDGVSLVPVLKNPDVRVRDHAYHAYPKKKLGRAIRTQRYRLVEWRQVGKPVESAEYELYDYKTDPQETRTLPQTIRTLSRPYERRWQNTRNRFVENPSPNQQPQRYQPKLSRRRPRAEQSRKEALVEVLTDRKPVPVMDAETIRAGLKSHDRALYIKSGWIRDPYISIGPEKKYYYLTGTQPNENDPREAKNPYNIGLGEESIVGHQVRLWRSRDLIQWESLGPIFTVDDTMRAKSGKKNPEASDLGAGSTLAGRQRLLGISALPQETL